MDRCRKGSGSDWSRGGFENSHPRRTTCPRRQAESPRTQDSCPGSRTHRRDGGSARRENSCSAGDGSPPSPHVRCCLFRPIRLVLIHRAPVSFESEFTNCPSMKVSTAERRAMGSSHLAFAGSCAQSFAAGSTQFRASSSSSFTMSASLPRGRWKTGVRSSSSTPASR